MPQRLKQDILLPLTVGSAIVVGAIAFLYVFSVPQPQRTPATTTSPPFQASSPDVASEQTIENDVTLIAVGDVMLSRAVARKMKQRRDLNYPFLKTRDFLSSAQIVFGNLEHPITPGRQIEDNELELRADPDIVPALESAGFTVLSLANNHLPDFGEQGVRDTITYLDRAGIAHAGAGNILEEAAKPAVIEVKGIRLAVLAFSDSDVVPASYGATETRAGTTLMDVAQMTEAVKSARTRVDFVIVSMHAGVEYASQPNKRQQEFARAAIDAGAELVIGHHPHVMQPVESYKGKYIFYSLGNFVFDQMWSRETREGMVAVVTLTQDGVHRVEFKPILIEDYSQPRFLEGVEADVVLGRLKLPR